MEIIIEKTCDLIRDSKKSVDQLENESVRNETGFWKNLSEKLSATKDFSLASKLKKRWSKNFQHYQDLVKSTLNADCYHIEKFQLENLQKRNFEIIFQPEEWNSVLKSVTKSKRKCLLKEFDKIKTSKVYNNV